MERGTVVAIIRLFPRHCQVEVDYPKLMPNMPGSRQESNLTSWGPVSRVFVNLTGPQEQSESVSASQSK